MVVLYRISLFSQSFKLERLYDAFIFPYMSYCSLTWEDAGVTHIKKIFILQKHAVRKITEIEFLQHTKPLIVQLKVLKKCELYRYSICIFIFRNKHLYQTLVKIRNTRSNDTVGVIFQILSLWQRSVFFSAAKVFYDLHLSLISLTQFSACMRSVKKFLLGNGLANLSNL